MERYAVDFGTSNTVVARWNFAREEPQTMSFPAITAPGSGAMPPVTHPSSTTGGGKLPNGLRGHLPRAG